MKPNIRLLRRIQRQILKEPRQFDMSYWFTEGDRIPNCGTAACIAGLATCLTVKLNPRKASRADLLPWNVAKDSLQLTDAQASSLFHQTLWPNKFHHAYARHTASGHRTKAAQVAVARIEHFIKTGE